MEDEWINVKDRLPEDYGPKLVYTADFLYERASNMNEQWFRAGVELHGVTHWMPLPNPPVKPQP